MAVPFQKSEVLPFQKSYRTAEARPSAAHSDDTGPHQKAGSAMDRPESADPFSRRNFLETTTQLTAAAATTAWPLTSDVDQQTGQRPGQS